jgi:hypothetical protein
MKEEQMLGIGCLIFGIVFLWWSIKQPDKGNDVLTGNAKGYIASIAFIVIGILFLVGKLHF